MGYNFPAECFQCASNRFCHMWWSIVMKKKLLCVASFIFSSSKWFKLANCCINRLPQVLTPHTSMKCGFQITDGHYSSYEWSLPTVKMVHSTLETLSWEALYPIQLTHQTWFLPITACLHQWVTHLLNSALAHRKIFKNGSINGSQQKRKIFTSMVFINCPKDGKMYKKQWSTL